MTGYTERFRYDKKGNIIGSTTMYDQGNSNDIKRFIIYDENDNLLSVKQVTENVSVNGSKSVKEHFTEYEYTFFDNKYIVSKIVKDGKTQLEAKHNGIFTTYSGYKEYDSSSTQYVYTDNKESKLVNTILCITKQVEEPIFDLFDVKQKVIENNSLVETIDRKILFGGTDIFCLHDVSYMAIEPDAEGNKIGRSEVTRWDIVDTEEKESSTIYHFKEIFNRRLLDSDYNVVEDESFNICDEFICDVYFELSKDKQVMSVRRVVENEDKDMSFDFITSYEPFGDDIIIHNVSRNVITKEVIAERKILKSNNLTIYNNYIQEGFRYNNETTCEKDSLGHNRVSSNSYIKYDIAADKVVESGGESYLYDKNDKLLMITVTTNNDFTRHSIFSYDDKGRCVLEVSEEYITHKYYAGDSKDEAFRTTSVGYPMCNSLFELYYNQLLESIND